MALSLTFGVMVLWSFLTPAPAPIRTLQPIPGVDLSQPVVTVGQKVSPNESLFESTLGDTKLVVGIPGGGIEGLQISGSPFLKEASPGLLQMELVGSPSKHLLFHSRQEGSVLVTEAQIIM